MSTKKRNKLSIKDKYDIITKLSDGMNRNELLKEYKLKSLSHLTELLKKKEEIIGKYNHLNTKSSEKSFTIKTAKYPTVERALVEWMRQMRHKKVSLTSEVILMKAKDFAIRLGIEGFVPTKGYLKGLKARHNILFTQKHGESESVDENVVKKWSEDLKVILKDYKPEDIYNMDEAALFWRLLPTKTYAFTDESSFGTKKSKDRITIVLVSNADGTDYYSQTNSWIDSEIYRKILNKLNRKMRSKKKNILLFVDNCRTHTEDITLSNIVVKFLPPNSTAKLQPLDQGIIHSFKAFYRKELIVKLIQKLDSGIDFSPKDITIYDAMIFLNTSLKAISNQTIINCFKKAKFDFSSELSEIDSESEVEDNTEFWEKLKTLTDIEFNTFESYVSVDNEECIEFVTELTDEQIVEQVLVENNNETIDISDEEMTECQELPNISNSQALESIDLLQKYFCQISDSGVDQQLVDIRLRINENTFKALKQTKITDFFA
jgi:hypothetical protein